VFTNIQDKLIKPAAVGVIPTDTVYGVVARASDHAAVERLYKLKQRETKPGTVIAATIEQLEELGLKHRYVTAVAQFWPGPVSVIIPCGPELAYIHRGKNGIAVRIPEDEALLALIKSTGPLLTSSANITGQPTAELITQAKAYFADNVDFYVDGGDLSKRQPSTIIRIIDDSIEIVRQGSKLIELDK
jgi:L-threonylcarbamoyladenylate synthase